MLYFWIWGNTVKQPCNNRSTDFLEVVHGAINQLDLVNESRDTHSSIIVFVGFGVNQAEKLLAESHSRFQTKTTDRTKQMKLRCPSMFMYK